MEWGGLLSGGGQLSPSHLFPRNAAKKFKMFGAFRGGDPVPIVHPEVLLQATVMSSAGFLVGAIDQGTTSSRFFVSFPSFQLGWVMDAHC